MSKMKDVAIDELNKARIDALIKKIDAEKNSVILPAFHIWCLLVAGFLVCAVMIFN